MKKTRQAVRITASDCIKATFWIFAGGLIAAIGTMLIAPR